MWSLPVGKGGGFGYTGPGRGAAQTPSGMIQLAFCDKTTSDSRWRTAEDYIANIWSAWLSDGTKNIYAYYAFAKAMRQAQPQEVVTLSATGLDWFGDKTQGLARYLIDRQQTDLGWPDFYALGTVGRGFSTSWTVMILTRTLFVKPPIAIVHASPNPGAVGQTIRFDASASYHLDPFHHIVSYQWDFDVSNDLDWAHPDATGPIVTHAYGALGNYTATLRVLDDNVPTRMDTDVVLIKITVPPHPPTAIAGGPYIAAIGESIKLDASGSYDIDASQGDSITAYGWEIDMISPRDFDDATGVNPTIPGFSIAGTYDIGLRVTDNTAKAFPASGSPNLTNDDFTEVIVYRQCISDLAVRPKETKAQLTWTHIGADEYKVYRSTKGPNIGMELIGTTSSDYSTFIDYNIELNKDYWYRVMVEDQSGICSSYAYYIRSTGRIRNRPPQITSTPPLSAQEGKVYSYDVEAQDPDGNPITYFLDQAPNGMNINSATGLIQWTPVFSQVGPNDVTVRVQDSPGASTSQFFTIVVTPRPNLPPVSVPDGPYHALRGEQIRFDGSGSYDPENDLPLSYQWNFGDGATSNEQNPIHVYTASGIYTVTLFVTDSRSATSRAETTAQIDEPNRIPTAEVVSGPDFEIRLGEALTLDGSPSYDPDGDALTYAWSWGDSTPPGTGVTASHNYTSEGSFHGSLTVDDGRGGIDTYEFTVVVGPPNNPPVASFIITEVGVNVGDQFTFDASATQDADGDPMSFNWDFGDSSTTTGIIVTHVFHASGDFTVTLTVRDNHQGEDTVSEVVHINALPQITTSPPLPDATEDLLYNVDIETTDADGDTLFFSLPTAPTGMTIDSATGLIQWIPQQSHGGLNSLTVSVDDGHGRIVSQNYNITVNLVNDAPIITSTPLTNGKEGVAYTYQVRATDEDDTVLTFSLDNFPDGMTIAADTGRISWTPSAIQAGSHPVTVKVTDPAFAFATQGYTIDVAEAISVPPVVTSTPVITGGEGQSDMYDIEVDDPDKDPVTFSLVTAPEGMTINSTTGLIEWLPAADQSGTHEVVVQIDDGRGGIIEHRFTITVDELLNLPPKIVSTP
ncbi:PKD domain-containing protein [Candidatus Poribacteria bacterium]|nr:PKD domain-containing protein [Candidatus Poribacteria bacterium]